MKKIKILASTLLLTFSMSSLGFADGNITVLINSLKLKTDVAPQIVNERTMVPIRAIAENMGATVEWNQQAKLVTVNSKQGTMSLTLNSNKAMVNGKQVKLDQPAKTINDRTMVPIRFISENMGADVYWNNRTRTVAIEQNKSIEKTPFNYSDLGNDITDMDKFVGYYGEPLSIEESYDDEYLHGMMYYYKYDFGTAWFIPNGDNAGHGLVHVDSTVNLVGIPRNIKIGDTISSVLSKFPNDKTYDKYGEDNLRILYYRDTDPDSVGLIEYDQQGEVSNVRFFNNFESGGSSGIIFNFKSNIISSIEFFYGYM